MSVFDFIGDNVTRDHPSGGLNFIDIAADNFFDSNIINNIADGDVLGIDTGNIWESIRSSETVENLLDHIPESLTSDFREFLIGTGDVFPSFENFSASGIFEGVFGDSLGGISGLLGDSNFLRQSGLLEGGLDLGGILGGAFRPDGFLGGFADSIGLGGIVGSVSDYVSNSPIGGVVGGIFGGEAGGLGGVLANLTGIEALAGPWGIGIMAAARILGLDKVLGKVIGGVLGGVKDIGEGIWNGAKSVVGGVADGIGGAIKGVGSFIGGLF